MAFLKAMFDQDVQSKHVVFEFVGLLVTKAFYFFDRVFIDTLSSYDIDWDSCALTKLTPKRNDNCGVCVKAMSVFWTAKAPKAGPLTKKVIIHMFEIYDWASSTGESLCGSIIANKVSENGGACYDLNVRGESTGIAGIMSRASMRSMGLINPISKSFHHHDRHASPEYATELTVPKVPVPRLIPKNR